MMEIIDENTFKIMTLLNNLVVSVEFKTVN